MKYAKNKDVGVILYLNDVGAKKFGLERVLKQFADWGAKGVKYGFMRGSWEEKVKHTRNVVEPCAKYKLMVNFHDNPVPPSGDRRTYPNLVTKEFGHSQADAKRSYFPEKPVTSSFVNMVAGPLDKGTLESFKYEKSDFAVSGVSDFTGTEFGFGFLLKMNRFNIGLNVNAPYTLEREWSYTNTIVDSTGTQKTVSSGVDKLDIPISASMGLHVAPTDEIFLSADLEYNPYSNAEFSFSDSELANDPNLNGWTDQISYRFGIMYKLNEMLSFMGGYKIVPETFVPNRAAIKDKGPEMESITFGISANILYGQFDIAYEYGKLKYFDNWESNLNYVFESVHNVMFGYTYIF